MLLNSITITVLDSFADQVNLIADLIVLVDGVKQTLTQNSQVVFNPETMSYELVVTYKNLELYKGTPDYTTIWIVSVLRVEVSNCGSETIQASLQQQTSQCVCSDGKGTMYLVAPSTDQTLQLSSLKHKQQTLNIQPPSKFETSITVNMYLMDVTLTIQDMFGNNLAPKYAVTVKVDSIALALSANSEITFEPSSEGYVVSVQFQGLILYEEHPSTLTVQVPGVVKVIVTDCGSDQLDLQYDTQTGTVFCQQGSGCLYFLQSILQSILNIYSTPYQTVEKSIGAHTQFETQITVQLKTITTKTIQIELKTLFSSADFTVWANQSVLALFGGVFAIQASYLAQTVFIKIFYKNLSVKSVFQQVLLQREVNEFVFEISDQKLEFLSTSIGYIKKNCLYTESTLLVGNLKLTSWGCQPVFQWELVDLNKVTLAFDEQTVVFRVEKVGQTQWINTMEPSGNARKPGALMVKIDELEGKKKGSCGNYLLNVKIGQLAAFHDYTYGQCQLQVVFEWEDLQNAILTVNGSSEEGELYVEQILSQNQVLQLQNSYLVLDKQMLQSKSYLIWILVPLGVVIILLSAMLIVKWKKAKNQKEIEKAFEYNDRTKGKELLSVTLYPAESV